MRIKRALAILTISVASFSAQATPVSFSNGHYYELFEFTDARLADLLSQSGKQRLDWNDANTFAQTQTYDGFAGHLATLSSQDEDDFVWNMGAQSFFLGAYDNSSYDENTHKWTHNAWQWVTGEAFSYQNFFFNEPNHWQDGSNLTPDNEDYLMYWSKESLDNQGRWNDTNLDSSYLEGGDIKYTTRGFVVEYEPITAAAPSAAVPLPPTLWLFAAGLGFLIRGKKSNA